MKTRLFLVIGALTAAFPVIASAQAPAGLPPGPGHDLVETACAACHAPDIVAQQARTKAEWSEVVDQMVGRGAAVSEADYPIVVEYLAKNFGPPGAAPAAAPAAPAAPAKKP